MFPKTTGRLAASVILLALIQACEGNRHVTIFGKHVPVNADSATIASAERVEFTYDCNKFRSQIETANDVGLLLRYIWASHMVARSLGRRKVVTEAELDAAYRAGDLRRVEFLTVNSICKNVHGVELKR